MGNGTLTWDQRPEGRRHQYHLVNCSSYRVVLPITGWGQSGLRPRDSCPWNPAFSESARSDRWCVQVFGEGADLSWEREPVVLQGFMTKARQSHWEGPHAVRWPSRCGQRNRRPPLQGQLKRRKQQTALPASAGARWGNVTPAGRMQSPPLGQCHSPWEFWWNKRTASSHLLENLHEILGTTEEYRYWLFLEVIADLEKRERAKI